MTLRLGYGLNGFTDHRLHDALAVVAGTGYEGVGLTLDHAHLDPFAPGLAARTAAVAGLLERHRLGVVVETGARYLLDPWRKHEPTLVSGSGTERRVELLVLAVQVAADLGATAVSFWSGILPADATRAQGWERLERHLLPVLDAADRAGVVLACEPEPGMFVDRLADVLELRRRLGDPHLLRVTVDVGHLRCSEDEPEADCIRGVAPLLANVQVDDMRRGVHEHLELGTGEVDLAGALGALVEVGYRGLACVELPRHPHAAPALAASSLAAMRAALQEAADRAAYGTTTAEVSR